MTDVRLAILSKKEQRSFITPTIMEKRKKLLSLNAHAKGTAPTFLKIINSVERNIEYQVSFFLESNGMKYSYRALCHGLEKPLGRDNRFMTVWGEIIGTENGWVSAHVEELPDKPLFFFTAIIDVHSPFFDRNAPCVLWFSRKGGLFYKYRVIRREFLDALKMCTEEVVV